MPLSSITLISALCFIGIMILLHVVKPEFNPTWRMISEYEIGKFGWLMRLAFWLWATCALSLLMILNQAGSSILINIWLCVLVAALIGAGIFRTDPILETTASLTNRLHTLCGALVILTFPILATIIAVRLISQGSIDNGMYVAGMTALTWIGQISFFASISVSQKKHPGAGRVGPDVKLGWPNRIMVLFFVLWIVVVSFSIK